MPRLTVRLTAEDDARLRAAAELRRVPVSDLVRDGVRVVVSAALALAVEPEDLAASSTPSTPSTSARTSTDARRGRDRRKAREAYAAADVTAWAGALAEHGDRRAARWPERREPRP